jgi:flagellar basal-body rod protein FlgC
MALSSVFDISAAGMNLERLRLEVSAVNLANANTTRGANGQPFSPLQVVVRSGATSFDALIDSMGVAGSGGGLPAGALPMGEVQPSDVAPRQVYDPGHPDADSKGFVSYPGVNPVSEMVQLIAVTRAYEANVKAFNAAHTMALKALEIGSGR